jgi:hypothetical protein
VKAEGPLGSHAGKWSLKVKLTTLKTITALTSEVETQ